MSTGRFLRLIPPSFVLLLIFACGGGEETMKEPATDVNPDKVVPNYFPMTVEILMVLSGYAKLRNPRISACISTMSSTIIRR